MHAVEYFWSDVYVKICCVSESLTYKKILKDVARIKYH